MRNPNHRVNQKKAICIKLEILYLNNTWELVHLPIGCKIRRSKGVFKVKYNNSKEIIKCQVWLVLDNYAQQHGINYNEKF